SLSMSLPTTPEAMFLSPAAGHIKMSPRSKTLLQVSLAVTSTRKSLSIATPGKLPVPGGSF
ncbi:MAG TPA: hypothetical protein PKY71_11830, partial [Smithellaceae bacterium]|nr:hypothetical protein [Smithellaceae bacterium]